MTNADRIRAMTDEELTNLMLNGCDYVSDSSICLNRTFDDKTCWFCLNNWLKQEVSE